jgi:hypothetical protein
MFLRGGVGKGGGTRPTRRASWSPQQSDSGSGEMNPNPDFLVFKSMRRIGEQAKLQPQPQPQKKMRKHWTQSKETTLKKLGQRAGG